MTETDPRLAAVGAAWDDSAAAGAWIAERLGPFGPSVGHAVPHGYESFAVVPVPRPDHGGPADADPRACGRTTSPLSVLMDVLRVLAVWTGKQDVHCGLWEGWGFLYDAGEDPLTAPGMAMFGFGADGAAMDARPATGESPLVPAARAGAAAHLLVRRVQRPAAPPLELPHRGYHLWTGPWRSAGALAHEHWSPPSLVWPEDRSWFVGAPIYTEDIAVAGSADMVRAVLTDPLLHGLGARLARLDETLRIDD